MSSKHYSIKPLGLEASQLLGSKKKYADISVSDKPGGDEVKKIRLTEKTAKAIMHLHSKLNPTSRPEANSLPVESHIEIAENVNQLW